MANVIPSNKLHPIRIAAHYSGLSAEVIRAWERRYQIIEPHRTAGNRRLYSDADINRLTLFAKAIKAGRRISSIATYTNRQLEEIIEEDRQLTHKPPRRQKRQNPSLVLEHFDSCLEAIVHFDLHALTNTLKTAEKSLGTIFFIEDLIDPLISHIREECRRGTMAEVNRHWFLNAIAVYLTQLSGQQGHHNKKLVAFATASDNDLTTLKAVASANALGWNTVYFDQTVSPQEVAESFELLQAQLLIIGAGTSSIYDYVPNQFRTLRELLPDTPIIAQVAGSPLLVIREIDAIYCRSLQQLQLELERFA